MTSFRRKKNTRQRASTTHGYGSMKKNRGAGNRGGRGNAGSGKKGDARKPYFRVKKNFELGKNGFGKIITRVRSINIADLHDKTTTLLESGIMQKKNDVYKIDLSDIKVDKLLASGKPGLKYEITVKQASVSAVEKIKKNGGNVKVLDKKLEENLKEPSEEESSDKQGSETSKIEE